MGLTLAAPRPFALLLAAVLIAGCGFSARAESPPPGYKKLTGGEIRRAFTGHIFTDEVHFSLRYLPAGALEATSMGKRSRGKWRVVKDELCSTDDFGEPCYEVWKNGNAISMRPKTGALSVEGLLK